MLVSSTLTDVFGINHMSLFLSQVLLICLWHHQLCVFKLSFLTMNQFKLQQHLPVVNTTPIYSEAEDTPLCGCPVFSNNRVHALRTWLLWAEQSRCEKRWWQLCGRPLFLFSETLPFSFCSLCVSQQRCSDQTKCEKQLKRKRPFYDCSVIMVQHTSGFIYSHYNVVILQRLIQKQSSQQQELNTSVMHKTEQGGQGTGAL